MPTHEELAGQNQNVKPLENQDVKPLENQDLSKLQAENQKLANENKKFADKFKDLEDFALKEKGEFKELYEKGVENSKAQTAELEKFRQREILQKEKLLKTMGDNAAKFKHLGIDDLENIISLAGKTPPQNQQGSSQNDRQTGSAESDSNLRKYIESVENGTPDKSYFDKGLQNGIKFGK